MAILKEVMDIRGTSRVFRTVHELLQQEAPEVLARPDRPEALSPTAQRLVVVLAKSQEASTAELFAAVLDFQDVTPSEVIDAVEALKSLSLVESAARPEAASDEDYYRLTVLGQRVAKLLGGNPRLLGHRIDLKAS